MLNNGDRVLIAVSGGPDSVVLLHLMKAIASEKRLELAVAHLNHMSRGPDSDADAHFVASLAKQLGLPIFSKRIDVVNERLVLKTSFQEAARILRYGFMEDALLKWNGNKIALGHTADDQAETVLINFLRGSGLSGLSGTPPIRDYFIRPLIECHRHQITWYIKKNKIPFRVDLSNQDRQYLRNRIRLELLPRLESEYNFRIKTHLLDTAEIFRDENAYFEGIAREAFHKCTTKYSSEGKVIIELAQFDSLHPAIRRRVLREAVRRVKGDVRRLTSNHVRSMEQLLTSSLPGKKLCLPEGLEIIVQKDKLFFEKNFGVSPSIATMGDCLYPMVLMIPGETIIASAGIVIQAEPVDRIDSHWKSASLNEAWLDFDKVGPNLLVRFPLPGDRFVPLGMTGRKKLKSYFIDEKVSKEERARTPILTNAEGDIIWVYGQRIANGFRVDAKTKKFLYLKGSESGLKRQTRRTWPS